MCSSTLSFTDETLQAIYFSHYMVTVSLLQKKGLSYLPRFMFCITRECERDSKFILQGTVYLAMLHSQRCFLLIMFSFWFHCCTD